MQRNPKQYRWQIFQVKSNFRSERGHSPFDPISLKPESDSTTFLSPEKDLNFLFNLVWILVWFFFLGGGKAQ